ncbi:S-layer domain protein [Desulfofarcimen acetoxidans DSM 771]|uniref:S-layer domain protein n=1 Tax=Desulfofarcimen acetoxidans (strain ATCC 49208 / DSM 771 / KCTC 5769 / VKM B-1644 / 5575) TaxID=485916 RepID=C8VYU3_DESAS|nr:S-layer homology domain-containing protein [Desulfofarcimen acetoxidans]ACV64814.1 S-layer domain protein [Desulfofarcimen acetoxidans DSM 771]
MWRYLYKLSIYAAVALVLMTVTTPAHAVNPLYFNDWCQGKSNQVLPSGYPAWLEDNAQDKENVAKAIKFELYTGYPDQTLKLTDNITRAEFAVALARVLDTGKDGGSTWYANRLDALVAEGILKGKTGDWSSPITRGEMGQWTGRAAGKYKADIKINSISFTDTVDSDILTAAKAGIISGYSDGSFKPKDNAQRVHAALMLVRLAEALNSKPLPNETDLSNIAQKAYEQEQIARKAWVQAKTKTPNYTPAEEYESSLNLKWLALAEVEYQKLKPNYGWAEDKLSYSAKPVEMHRTTAIIEISGRVQNYDKAGNKLYDELDYKGSQYFIKRDGKWVLTHGEPVH